MIKTWHNQDKEDEDDEEKEDQDEGSRMIGARIAKLGD